MNPLLSGLLFGLGFFGVAAAGRALLWRRHGRHHHHHHHHHGRHPGRAGWLARRIAATPEQARVLEEALDHVLEVARPLRAGWPDSRHALADLLRADTFDAARLQDAFGRLEGRVQQVRETLAAELARVHAALGPDQRLALARVLEHGPRYHP